jgi:hypothetical protein
MTGKHRIDYMVDSEGIEELNAKETNHLENTEGGETSIFGSLLTSNVFSVFSVVIF